MTNRTPQAAFIQLIDNPLNIVIPDLNNANKIKEVKWLQPSETIADLDSTMYIHKIRTIPILDSNPGNLRGLVSLVDSAKLLTPPESKLPTERLAKAGFDMDLLQDWVMQIGSQPIAEALKSLINDNTQFLLENESLGAAISKLIHREANNRRYRTLPIFDKGSRLVRTLSYIDVLRIVRDGTGINGFLNTMTARDILNPKVTTLARNKKLKDATFTLNRLPFTHIPITTEDSKTTVLGIVDDVAIRTLEHPLLDQYLKDMPLDEIMAKLWGSNTTKQDPNIIKPNESVRALIGKFVDGDERPTAILVGNYNAAEEFEMEGIVSYVDIFKKLLEFLQPMRVQQPAG